MSALGDRGGRDASASRPGPQPRPANRVDERNTVLGLVRIAGARGVPASTLVDVLVEVHDVPRDVSESMIREMLDDDLDLGPRFRLVCR